MRAGTHFVRCVQVRLNWENVDWAWVVPGEIRSMRAVPLLAET